MSPQARSRTARVLVRTRLPRHGDNIPPRPFTLVRPLPPPRSADHSADLVHTPRAVQAKWPSCPFGHSGHLVRLERFVNLLLGAWT